MWSKSFDWIDTSNCSHWPNWGHIFIDGWRFCSFVLLRTRQLVSRGKKNSLKLLISGWWGWLWQWHKLCGSPQVWNKQLRWRELWRHGRLLLRPKYYRNQVYWRRLLLFWVRALQRGRGGLWFKLGLWESPPLWFEQLWPDEPWLWPNRRLLLRSKPKNSRNSHGKWYDITTKFHNCHKPKV